MKTVYDWLTVAAFAGLVVLFLHRSDAAAPPRDRLWHYLAASAGCAWINWLGNGGRHWGAAAAIAVLIVFVLRVLRPFDRTG